MDALTNPEAEASIIGHLMYDNGVVDAIADRLNADDFAESIHQRLFNAILHEVSLGKLVNPVTLKPYFDSDPDLPALGGIGYLAALYSEAGIFDIFALAKHVVELSKRRKLRDGLTATAERCADMELTTGELIQEADAALTLDGKEIIHQPTGAECLDELIEGFADETPGITSGSIRSLDNVLGALKPKQLVILAARPGMGKTAVALSYGLGAAASGHGVLFVSLEMGSAELGGRMAADICFNREAVPFSNITQNKLSDNQYRSIRAARNTIAELPFQVVDTGNLAIGRLRSLVRRHKRKFEAQGQSLDLVIVDYLQLLSSDHRGSKYEMVSEVSQGMKAIAKELDVAVMALAQLSREVEKRPDRRPQLSDLRDSGQIEQDADAVLFLLREEYYLQQAEPDRMEPSYYGWAEDIEKQRGKIEFIVAKRRNGVTGTSMGEFHGQFQAVRG